MKKIFPLGITAAFLTIGNIIVMQPVFAEVTPESKCITATTQATNASMTARMEKDVAPYAQNTAAASAIQHYRDGMTTAWAAMHEPYCGFGTYGTASAIKSYAKSVERARSAFITAVKGSTKTAALIPEQPPKLTQTKTTTVTVNAPNAKASGTISAGLHIGMRSDDIKRLQEKLAVILKTPSDATTITGYFGPKTQSLVIQFQLEQKIIASATASGAGLVGPKTAQALNSR